MYSGQNRTSKNSSNSSDTPAPSQFAPRRFVVQPKTEEVKPVQEQTPEKQTQGEEVKQYKSAFIDASKFTPRPSPVVTPRVQMKLTIGQPGDKYEQEADRMAQLVVQRINAPQSESVQRQELPLDEDELQMKPLSGTIQRSAKPEDDDELQMKPMVQGLSAEGGMAATPDLEESIQGAKGSGQPLAENVRQPMEKAFGADFSGVKVHTDAQSDQLNQSIQAKAFTTGQDVFFRQGAYEPGSQGGQELLAHELTHVVQQSSGQLVQMHKSRETSVIQRLDVDPINTDQEDLVNGGDPAEKLDGPNDLREGIGKRRRGDQAVTEEERPAKSMQFDEEPELQLKEMTNVVQQNRDNLQSETAAPLNEEVHQNLWAKIPSPPNITSLWGDRKTESSKSSPSVIQRVTTRSGGSRATGPGATSYTGMATGGGGGHPPVPKSQWQAHTVNGINYKFWNAADGTLEFTGNVSPLPGGAGPALVANHTVNIDAGGGKLIHTGRSLKNSRYQHFLAANIDYEGINPPVNQGYSPPGFTWHHHKNQGVMELIDRNVHGTFGHHGGFSIWGS